MSEEIKQPDDLKYFCTELNANRRHYSSLRFAMLSIYFAVFGGLASVSFGLVETKTVSTLNLTIWAKWGGLIFTLVFFWVEILCELNLRHIYRIANKELPSSYLQMTRRKGHPALKAYYATWGLYTLLILFWIITLAKEYWRLYFIVG